MQHFYFIINCIDSDQMPQFAAIIGLDKETSVLAQVRYMYLYCNGPASSVHNLKIVYLSSQLTNCDGMSCKPSPGKGKGCIRFLGESEWNSDSHGNI